MYLAPLLILLLIPTNSAQPPSAPLTTPLVNCPCTFTVSRPVSDNTPFSIIILDGKHPNPHPLSRHNLTNLQAAYNTSTAVFFYAHIPHPTRHAITIRSQSTRFEISHTTHTTCPTLLNPDPPGLFRQNIVGGSSASPDLREYLAYLYNPSSGRACSGTIIAPRWIITAAHCDVTQRHIAYLRGEKERQGIPYAIRRVTPYTQFTDDSNAHFDIAIVELFTPALRASFMQVSVNPQLPVTATAARVVGYGSVAFDSPTQGVLFGQLRQVDVPIVSHAQCVFVYSMIVERFQVCAGYLGRGGCDSCQGDSGGPLIQYDARGEPVLVGVVSRGIRCGEARFPGVYIRVGAFERWIDSVVVDLYQKANNTRAVLAVTGSSKATFRNLIVPVIAVCGGVLVAGLVTLLIVKVRRRKRGKSSEFEISGDEGTGSTDGVDSMKQWEGQQVHSPRTRYSAPVETGAIGSAAMNDRRPQSTPAAEHGLVTSIDVNGR